MSSIIELSCPECDRPMKAPASGVGKRISCKGCGHKFVIEAPKRSTRPAPKKKAQVQKKVTPKKKAAVSTPESEAEEGYDVQELSTKRRCPDCANLMASEEAVICLHCGYNTQTREKVESRVLVEQTGGDKFKWLLPGILCTILMLILIGYCFFHHFALPGITDEGLGNFLKKTSMSRTQIFNPFQSEDDMDKELKDLDLEWWTIIFHPMIELWMVLGTAYISFKAGKFAYKRLILHPNPPEIEKEERKRSQG